MGTPTTLSCPKTGSLGMNQTSWTSKVPTPPHSWRSRKPPANLWDPGLKDLQFQIQNISWCPAVPGLPFNSDAVSPWYPRDGSRNCKGSQIPWILKSHSQPSVLAASTCKDSANLGWWTQYRIWTWLNPWMGGVGAAVFLFTPTSAQGSPFIATDWPLPLSDEPKSSAPSAHLPWRRLTPAAHQEGPAKHHLCESWCEFKLCSPWGCFSYLTISL